MRASRPGSIARRDFLKLSGLSLGALLFSPLERAIPLPQFPSADMLGRVAVYPNFYTTEIKTQPSRQAATIRVVPEDEVVVWGREVVGLDSYVGNSRRWVETPEGYIYAPHLQPVRNLPNMPLTGMPEGKPGFWAEVTVPYVDLYVEGLLRAPWAQDILSGGQLPRLYYSQVAWIDQIRTNEAGQILYRFNEDIGHGYGYGDVFWAEAAAFRPLTPEEVAPISPEVDPNLKTIIIDSTSQYQTLSCFEGSTEVFFCRVSTGYESLATPVGPNQATHWKIISVHMSGGTTGAGYDTPAVSWCTYFHGDGIAIHAAFWHNDFGTRRSHGCVNARPEDAKWIFRWTTPHISLEQSEMRMTWPDHGTLVTVTERTFG